MKTEMNSPPRARDFCRIVESASLSKLDGSWSGSVYRHHPRGIIRWPLILSSEWNTNHYCYASFMTERSDMTTPSNHPASSGGDPHPHPISGEEVKFYYTGRWIGEDGPWRGALIHLLHTIENELADISLEKEWNRKIQEIENRRLEANSWDKKRNQWFKAVR